jgi:hypothetical protein
VHAGNHASDSPARHVLNVVDVGNEQLLEAGAHGLEVLLCQPLTRLLADDGIHQFMLEIMPGVLDVQLQCILG